MSSLPATYVDSSVVNFQRDHARIGPAYQLAQFWASSSDGCWHLSADASELGLRPGLWPKRFTVTNPDTGRTVVFALADEQEQLDGEGRQYTSTMDNVTATVWAD